MNSAEFSNDIMYLVFGGGGVAIITALAKLVNDFRLGKIRKEESAVAFHKNRADALADENKELEQQLGAYRAAYASLWRAYQIGPPPGALDFPFDPTAKE